MTDLGFDGKVAIITGAGGGLGRQHALMLAKRGALIVVNDLGGSIDGTGSDKGAAQLVVDEIKDAGGEAVANTDSVATPEGGKAIVQSAIDAFGKIDILINNAGINRRGAIEDLTEDDFDAVMATNVKGVFLACRAFLPQMRTRGWGRVVNLASILGTVGMSQRVPYASSKAAVANMTRVLGLEFATTGVTVNAIAPGPFATEMNRSLLDDPAKYKAFVEKIPMGRWGELHELTGAVLFLSSNASSFVTGSILHVDGGWTAQ
jgi:NAD(P)-dependent dehydrogenase (short-subunit alcohol dehydrogenase family)